MATWYLHTVLTLLSSASAFHLYPTVNPDNLAKSFGISANCLDALNTTVTCDQDLFLWANSVDTYWWSEPNVTDLCTSDCMTSAGNWNTDVQERCDRQSIVVYGKMVEADSVPGRYYDGLNIACLTPSSNSNSSNSSPKPNTSISSPAGWNSSTSATSTSMTNSSTTTWCLLESQEWIGSDTIEPECDNNSTNFLCSDPTENDRIANLYDNEMLCSSCFLQMYFRRISSPYLPDSDYSDYLVSQYQDIIDVCNATMPDLVIRAPPAYEDAPPPGPRLTFGTNNATTSAGNSAFHGPYSMNGTSLNGTSSDGTSINGTDAMNNTCQGQMIQSSTIHTSCNDFSRDYSVTTGDLQAATGNDDCSLKAPVCVPAACTLKQVSANATCVSLASSCSTDQIGGVTVVQFLNWNPNINGLCDNPTAGDYVCASPPGGFYTPLPAPSGRAMNAGTQARGGGDGSFVGGTASINNNNSSNTATNITTAFSSSSAASPSSSSPSPSSSPSVAVNFPSDAPPSPPATKASAAAAAPSPTQTGISTACDKYARAASGDSCAKFAQTNNVTPDDLYAWNTALGAGGSNCNEEFWAGYYYCVGV